MRRRVVVAVMIAVLVATACGGGGGGGARDRRTVNAALDRMSSRSYTFEYKDQLTQPATEIVVRGAVYDDFRQEATMSVDGTDVIEQIISDDAIAVRVLDRKAAAPYIAQVRTQDKGAADALAAGKWIIDHQGAPDLIAPRTSENSVQVGTNPMLDATNYLYQYVEDALNDAGGPGLQAIGEWNPDGVGYNPLDDPWEEDAELDLVDQGIRRYDIAQPPLPRPTERGSAGSLAGPPHFRKMAFYLDGQDVTMIREQIKIDDRQEFRRSRAGRAAEYYQDLLAQSLAGFTREPVRQRQMEITFEPSDDVDVQLPKEDFVTVPALDLTSGVATLLPEPQRNRSFGTGGATPSPAPEATDEADEADAADQADEETEATDAP